MRRVLTNEEKELIGTKCCNCGSEEDLQYHHIVPIVLGGNDILSNMCCLCYSCHYKVHHQKESRAKNHSELIKQGIASSNKKCGRKNGNLDKMTNELREDIKKALSSSKIKYSELMKKHNISRNTLKKYIEIVSEGKIVGNKRSIRPLDDELKYAIKNYLSNRNIKTDDFLKENGISRNTLKKYIEIVKNEEEI